MHRGDRVTLQNKYILRTRDGAFDGESTSDQEQQAERPLQVNHRKQGVDLPTAAGASKVLCL